METLDQLTRRFVSLTADAEPDINLLQGLAQEIMAASQRATPSGQEAALSGLAVALQHEHPQVASVAAITGGALVENGISPANLAPALLGRLPNILGASADFADACIATLPERNEDDEEEESGSPEDLWIGDRPVPKEIAEAIIAQNPRGFAAYQALEPWYLPAIACLSYSADIRREAKKRPELLQQAERLVPYHAAGEYLRKMLLVLDEEPLLILHPGTRQGFRSRMGGISDNFQLHTLLMDALITEPRPAGLLDRIFRRGDQKGFAGLPGRRPHPMAVAVAKGEGPQQSDAPSFGAFNLYNWTIWEESASQPNTSVASLFSGSSPEGKSPFAAPMEGLQHWIWGEGIPADIVPFEGLRVILLGPPPYERGWNTARLFGGMKAYLRLEETLTAEAVNTHLKRFAAAPRPDLPD